MLNLLLQKRRDKDQEDGFTLIELMVVVLIIAILIAIAIPTFLGARERAQDRAAQSSLRNALTAAKTIYTDTGSYSSATAAALTSVEPSLQFQTSASTSEKEVAVHATPSAGTFAAAALSDSGTCFGIKDVATGASAGTTYGKPSGTCNEASAAGVSSASW